MNPVHEIQNGSDFVSSLSIEINQKVTIGTFNDKIKV